MLRAGRTPLACGSAKEPRCTHYLHETIVSGVVVAIAPAFLEAEIQEHIGDIAEEEGVPAERVREEWEQFRVLIRFYDPSSSTPPRDYVDPEDADYIQVLEQANGDFVYTSDLHFTEIGARVMPAGLDRVLRDYARSTTVILTVKLGSGFAMVVGGHMIYGLAILVADFVRKLPPFLKVLLSFKFAGSSVAAAPTLQLEQMEHSMSAPALGAQSPTPTTPSISSNY
jgi:hypothetical protein